jgi:hypothetical protein
VTIESNRPPISASLALPRLDELAEVFNKFVPVGELRSLAIQHDGFSSTG